MTLKIIGSFIAIFHLFAFYLETLAWGGTLSNKVFRVRPEDLHATQLLAANQGVYNLVLAIGMLVALFVLPSSGPWSQYRLPIMDFVAFFALCAGLALFITAPHLYRGALLQGLPGLIFLVVRFRTVS